MVVISGYLIAVICHVAIDKNIIRENEVYNKFCIGYESSCNCELGTYGIVERGFPFVSGRDSLYPCNTVAVVEERSILDYERSSNTGFIANTVVWSLTGIILIKLFNTLRMKK